MQELKKMFGILVILMGITMTVLNIIIMIKIQSTTCKDNTTLKNSNTGNLVLGIILTVIGIGLYITGYMNDYSDSFGFS